MIARALTVGAVLVLLGLPDTTNAQTIPGALPESSKALSQGEWPAYAGACCGFALFAADADRPQQRRQTACGLALEVA